LELFLTVNIPAVTKSIACWNFKNSALFFHSLCV